MNPELIDERVKIWSPNFRGSKAAWEWVANVSNGRHCDPPALTDEQIRDAYACGYINTAARDKLNAKI